MPSAAPSSVAAVQYAGGHGGALGRGECGAQVRQRHAAQERRRGGGGPGRGCAGVLLGTPHLRHGRLGQVEAGVAGQEAIVFRSQARGGHQRVAPAVGAAAKVRTVRSAAVGGGDQRLGHGRELLRGLVAVVQPRLRLEAEAGCLRRGVPGVGADHRKALQQRAGQRPAAAAAANGGNHVAVGPAVGLVVEAAVPGLRQAHLEANGIGLAVAAGAAVHAARHHAMRAHRVAGHAQLACRHVGGGIDGRVGRGKGAGQRAAGVQRAGPGRRKLRQRPRRARAVVLALLLLRQLFCLLLCRRGRWGGGLVATAGRKAGPCHQAGSGGYPSAHC
jgi:hypothetical protein